jgi:hypothetical protein
MKSIVSASSDVAEAMKLAKIMIKESYQPIIRMIDPKTPEERDADLMKFFKAGFAGDKSVPTVLPEWEGKKKWVIKCEHCGVTLGCFYGDAPKIKDSFGLHIYSMTDGKKWYGCFGGNYTNGVYNFECCCGHKSVRHPKDIKVKENGIEAVAKKPLRYVKYYILPA